jgi:UDP-galactopyranose mutase
MIYDLIVFSHLRWDFVYQRPQHLMSRFATAHRVIFFEEPVLDESTFLEFKSHGNVLVCIPHTPEQASGFHDKQLPYLNTLLENLVRDENLKDYVALVLYAHGTAVITSTATSQHYLRLHG